METVNYKHNGQYDIEPSDLLTKLIHEAGRWTEINASDLFYIWHMVIEEMQEPGYKGGVYYIGFRDTGVDTGDRFVYHMKQGNSYMFRAIYKLEAIEEDRGNEETVLRIKLNQMNYFVAKEEVTGKCY